MDSFERKQLRRANDSKKQWKKKALDRQEQNRKLQKRYEYAKKVIEDLKKK